MPDESVSPDIEIEQWISSNTQLLGLLRQFNYDYLGDPEGTDVLASLLSCITNAPNLQPLGRYNALRFWSELLIEGERKYVLIHLRDADLSMQKKGVAVIYALFKHYIPIVDPPLPFAVPLWKLFEWPDGQWQDMVEEMNADSLYDTLPTLSCKIRIPADVTDPDWEFISTVCSHSEGRDVSVDVAKDVCRQLHLIKNNFWSSEVLNPDNKVDPATSFRSFLSTPVFRDGGGTWDYNEGFSCPISFFGYPVKHANARLTKKRISLDWHVADKNCFPMIMANSASNPKDYGEYQVCYQSIAVLHIARTAIAETTDSVRPQRISVMALYVSRSGVKRYVFSFHNSEPQRIQCWYSFFDFRKLEDLGKLWLELWNSRMMLAHQFGDFPLTDWLDNFRIEQFYVEQFPILTPSNSSSRVIFSRRRSQSECVDPLDQEQRKNRVTWLNSWLRTYKYRVDKFIHANVIRIVQWSTLEVVEYAKFFLDDSYELSIHHHLLALSNHPHNRTVPILRLLHYLEGYTVAFMPNAGERLSTPSTIKRLFAIALQICQAVLFMHQHGIAHLDLKLENIVLSSDDRITIIDFSCAYHIPPPPGLITESVGTPGYMAPEVEQGIPYDPILADIYSLGWVLRRLCSLLFDPFYDMATTITIADPLLRPSIPQIIAHIESFISQPSLWEHIDIYNNDPQCILKLLSGV